MAPRPDEVDSETEVGEETEDRARSQLQNPTVLRAALEIVRRKKAEAIEAEEYEQAARFHQKLQDLEAKLRERGIDPAALEPLLTGDVGVEAVAAAVGANVASAAAPKCAAAGAGEAGQDVGVLPRSPRSWRSLMSAPNPFRTVELLRQSGYSKGQAYGLMGVLYVAVFALELGLLYVGLQFLGQSSGGGGEEGVDYEEF
mmetsp:Transcript_68945/g.224707  ORF Transcript_68945/g.224707 Transcript_68945/m.224707 type:complete len:200 (+) Transcript_68945:170-769(+)